MGSKPSQGQQLEDAKAGAQSSGYTQTNGHRSEGATWATPSGHGLTGHANSTASNTGGGGPGRQASSITDSEAESEIEIIDEGKPQRRQGLDLLDDNPAANGQEAPEIMEVEGKREEEVPVVNLSKQQQEEAAKLAEQRKKFDQRYQKDGKDANPNATTSTGPPRTPASQRGTDMVMGLNLTSDVDQTRDSGHEDFLPGGIVDDDACPGGVPVKKVQNKHDMFDDDDEVLMAEIMDESGPAEAF